MVGVKGAVSWAGILLLGLASGNAAIRSIGIFFFLENLKLQKEIFHFYEIVYLNPIMIRFLQ